jgi:conjugal transfer mating pair stabilization protein TraN
MNAGCPYGAQYACMQNPNLLNANGQGGWQCSPNACVNTGPGGAADIGDKMDESYFQDDGEKDADGNCLGTVYIFGGKPSRCRPPGLVVGTINDCCEPGDKIIDEDTGGNIQTAMSAISTLYDMAQVAYYSYGVATGAYTTAVGASGAVVLTSTTTAAATTLTGAVGAGVAGSAGAAGAGGAVASGLSSYAAALFNPATIAIAIVIFVVMKVLMGSGCDQTDLQTTMARDSGMCHFVADYCFRKWAMVGCVQKAKGYCCFNSRLARIIHEQGRPQLTAFGADGGWGSLGSDPECRGFTPEEFQSIDFNLIDLSEYYDVVQKDMGDKLNNAQQNVLTTIQNKVNNINQ